MQIESNATACPHNHDYSSHDDDDDCQHGDNDDDRSNNFYLC